MMTPRTSKAILLLAGVLLICGTLGAQVTDWKQIKTPPLPPFQPKEPARVELPNGMVLFLQEDHELPLIDASLRVRGGSREEPATKAGMVSVYGDAWRTGGTHSKTGDELDDFLEARAARIETDNTSDATTMSLSCLKADFDQVFAVLVDLLRNPEFRPDKVDLSKDQLKSAISRRNDNISQIAGREATRLAYGKDNPYARVAEYATVDAITRDDLLSWHKQWAQPNNIIFGIVGDFDSKAMEQKLRDAFGSWPKGPAAPKFETTYTTAKPGVYFVNKEDVNQSEIRMVSVGIRRDNPDYFAVEVMNEIFGGGFSSRLFSRIRSQQGLAYAVYGGVGASFDHPGVFRIGMGTKSTSTVQAIQSLNQQIDDLIKTPPSEAEMRRSKDAILNSFIFNFDTPQKVLAEKMAYEFYHYPLDFLEKYRAGIEKVTADDVARVARKYVHKDQMPILVVGNEADMGSAKLTALGPVTPVDITIPTPGEASEGESAPAASNPEGKALIAKFVKAMGGTEALAKVKAIQQKTTVVHKTPRGDMSMERESVVVFPDRLFSQMNMPMGQIRAVLAPGANYLSNGTQSQPMPAPIKEEIAGALKRDFVAVAQHADSPDYTFAADGTEKVGNVTASVLQVATAGSRTTWYIDPASGFPLRTTYMTMGDRGPVRQVEDFSDWKPVHGISLWNHRTVSENGQLVSQETVQEWTLNPQTDPGMFQKPANMASGGAEGEGKQ